MSSAHSTGQIDEIVQFYRDYYADEISALIEGYPRDKKSMYIDWRELSRALPDLADDYLTHPDEIRPVLKEGLANYDAPVDISDDFAQANIRVTNLLDPDVHGVADLRAEHGTDYLGVTGQVAKVSGSKPRVDVAAFECQRCGTQTRIPQTFAEYREPHECQGCERQGPFEVDFGQSDLVDHVVLRLKEPPESANGDGQSLTVYLEDDLIDVGGDNGIADRAGERATIHGHLRYDESELKGQNARPIADEYLDAEAIEFEESVLEDIDTSEHKERFTELAAREDAPELLAQSVAPEISADEQMDDVFLASVLYLFAGYRKAPSKGATYRGDIHMLLIGDPGLAKSTVLSKIEELSPRSEAVSGTALSGVGLTAAAVRDDFGGGQWSLSPGVLPKANGGHAIIDEIDKADSDTPEKMHDALEGDQQVKVSKAGIKAQLNTRTGLVASGNPVEGRFTRYENLADQIDLDPALLSRFDLIFTLQDKIDLERDTTVSSHILDAWQETGDAERNPGAVEQDVTERPVEPDCFRAWVAYARQNVFPRLPDGEVKDRLQEFYIQTRRANKTEDEDDNDATISDPEDEPIPATPRTLEAGLRLAEASARIRLADTITVEDAERAIRVSRRVIGDTVWDPETKEFDGDRTATGNPKSQRDRIRGLKTLIRDMQNSDEFDTGVPESDILDAAEADGMSRSKAESTFEKLRREGEVYEPETDRWRAT